MLPRGKETDVKVSKAYKRKTELRLRWQLVRGGTGQEKWYSDPTIKWRAI